MFFWLRKLFWQIVFWFRPGETGSAAPQAQQPQSRPRTPALTPPELLAMDIIPPPIPRETPKIAPLSEPVFPHKRAKWAKPKGLEKIKPVERLASDKPRQPRKPKPVSHPATEDPEQWGQYYFRDSILDQLDLYFTYLKRMRTRDRDAYALHRKLGIALMPRSAIKTFDSWRNNDEEMELSAWWKNNRPGFGAVAYGIDASAEKTDHTFFVDRPSRTKEDDDWEPQGFGRLATITSTNIQTKWGKAGAIWTPRFLYFHKYNRRKRPLEFQSVPDGDVYAMTVYWDHGHKDMRKRRELRHGGIPQDYGVWVSPDGQVEVLRMRRDPSSFTARQGSDRGKRFTIPSGGWRIPTDYLEWTQGNVHNSPRQMLRKMFIEAALMYESAEMGSMVRIEVSKENLTAVFGVEIKRMSYFFKDRDITVNINGRRHPIFHIVRPHERVTKHGIKYVPMHFRGLKKFTWAGHGVSITVPGRDHFPLPEMNVGAYDARHPIKEKSLDMDQFADKVRSWIDEGIK